MKNPSAHGTRGRLKAVILDWAGTTVDYGSFAPTAVFIKLFASRGVTISMAQARQPMGLMKKDHLQAVAAIPEVAEQWRVVHGAPLTPAGLDAMFADFIPMQIAVLSEYAEPIPGVLAAQAAFRLLGLKIGTTTGYTRAMMAVLAPEAARRGYQPDAWVASDDVPAGRPYPWMLYRNMQELGVYPPAACVKIGDTLVDIEEGLNAGAWTIGLALTGNLLGLTAAEHAALSPADLAARRDEIYARLFEAGAHYVADSLLDCVPLIEAINQRLAQGDQP